VNPFFFGPPDRQLFGAYDAPSGSAKRAVVLCNAIGREYLLAHPTLRLLARQLSAAGWHVLRFDYSGTGDSAGECEDATLEQWVADIHAAIDELKEMAQVVSVALIGMRLGAALAALAATNRPDVDRLVLWDPVSDGSRYFAEAGARILVSSVDETAGCEMSGVVLSPVMQNDIERLTPDAYGAGLPRTLLLATGAPAREISPLRDRFARAGVNCTEQRTSDVVAWNTEWGSGGVGLPVTSMRAIAEWLA
jgi:pimeloyl-ACP methyl ester carboxylesterase